MANNINVLDGAAASKTFKTTDNAGIHTSHVNVDFLPVGTATAANQTTIITHLAAIEAAAEDTTTPVPVKNVLETTNTPTQVVLAAATSNTLKIATSGRIRFVIYNPTAAVLYVRKAAVAASATVFDIVIPAGGSYFSNPYEWAGEVRAFSTPGGTINFSESV